MVQGWIEKCLFRTKGSESHNFVPSTSTLSRLESQHFLPSWNPSYDSPHSSPLKTRDSTRPGNESFVCGPVLLIVPRIIYSPWRAASLPTQISFPSFPLNLFFAPLFRPALNFSFPFHGLLFFYTRTPSSNPKSPSAPEGRCTLSPNSISLPLLSASLINESLPDLYYDSTLPLQRFLHLPRSKIR